MWLAKPNKAAKPTFIVHSFLFGNALVHASGPLLNLSSWRGCHPLGDALPFTRVIQHRGSLRLPLYPPIATDESHFGKFTGWYSTRSYYFDIHPPLGKLTLWAVGKLVGYDPLVCRYESISEHYSETCKFIFLRATSASFSTLTCVLMYLVARKWGASVWGGIAAWGLLVTDMLALIEGRLILLDAQLIFWLVLSLYAGLCWWGRLNEDADAADVVADGGAEPAARAAAAAKRMSVRERACWAVGLGVICGNAFSVKMTGLATPAIIGLESAFAVFFLKRAAPFPDMLGVLASGLAAYIWWFRVHYWVMINWTIQTGEGHPQHR